MKKQRTCHGPDTRRHALRPLVVQAPYHRQPPAWISPALDDDWDLPHTN